jgi:hypothetical protein
MYLPCGRIAHRLIETVAYAAIFNEPPRRKRRGINNEKC